MPATTCSNSRLVIRIKLIPQQPAEPPRRWRLNKYALLMIGAVAALLSWFGISTFKTAPASAPVVSTPPLPKQVEATPVAPEVLQQADAPTSSINEVIPDVPRSALDTIRGTVRVTVRVTVDKQGAITAATADERGPSRYFERLAVGAAKKWTFTPTNAEAPRIMLVKFNFTRAGVTAQAGPV